MDYPAAHGRFLPDGLNHRSGGNHPRLLIIHHMEGTLNGTDGWFHNPKSQVSAHFGIGKDGTVVQWVDTGDQAWHAVNANDHSIGVECEGWHTQPLTTAQIHAIVKLYKWVNEKYPEVSMWLNTRPDTGSGLSWHGLGGVEWGNHPDCPGMPTVHQLQDILNEAKS